MRFNSISNRYNLGNLYFNMCTHTLYYHLLSIYYLYSNIKLVLYKNYMLCTYTDVAVGIYISTYIPSHVFTLELVLHIMYNVSYIIK